LSAAEEGTLAQLRDKIKTDKSKKMFGGRYIERGTVMRCDWEESSKDDDMIKDDDKTKDDNKAEGDGTLDDDKTNDASVKSSPVTAVFSSFPYLRIRKATKMASDHDKSYPEMSLLQSMYPFESTDERDSEQTTCTILEGAGRIVSVPQLWTLSFGRNLLTCAPTSLSEIRARHLQMTVPSVSWGATNYAVARYYDQTGQPFCLTISNNTSLFVS
jgi:hypothetical protein